MSVCSEEASFRTLGSAGFQDLRASRGLCQVGVYVWTPVEERFAIKESIIVSEVLTGVTSLTDAFDLAALYKTVLHETLRPSKFELCHRLVSIRRQTLLNRLHT